MPKYFAPANSSLQICPLYGICGQLNKFTLQNREIGMVIVRIKLIDTMND